MMYTVGDDVHCCYTVGDAVQCALSSCEMECVECVAGVPGQHVAWGHEALLQAQTDRVPYVQAQAQRWTQLDTEAACLWMPGQHPLG